MHRANTYCLLAALAALFSLTIPSCSENPDKTATTQARHPGEGITVSAQECQDCHTLILDISHQFPCTDCHQGQTTASSKDEAHTGLVAKPSSPDLMQHFCGKCHAETVNQIRNTLHFTLRNEVNLTRKSFGALSDLNSLTEIPDNPLPDSTLALADDMLRRRCLRCHVYYPGEPYPETVHGTGCAACHLPFDHNGLSSHLFAAKPADKQCLSCHYGNHVGADYYGRFEQDLSWEYWTPFSATDEQDRPQGVASYSLTPDIHLRAGMSCIDCHSGSQLMENAPGPSCSVCHEIKNNRQTLAHVAIENGAYILTTRHSGQRLTIPQLQHPAHQEFSDIASCQACHAQWSFADQAVHLLRQDINDYEQWQALTRQGSHEVEQQLEQALFMENDESDAFMVDKISQVFKAGIWLKSFDLRRWEEVNLCQDSQGLLQVCRSILDLHLSYVNFDGAVVIDSAASDRRYGSLPYTPHTTGNAGAFYRQRLKHHLANP